VDHVAAGAGGGRLVVVPTKPAMVCGTVVSPQYSTVVRAAHPPNTSLPKLLNLVVAAIIAWDDVILQVRKIYLVRVGL
jgi:hypothetical protein